MLSIASLVIAAGGLLLQTGHSQIVTDLAFSNTTPLLASAGAERRVLFWDPASGLTERRYSHASTAPSSIAWSADDTLVALGNTDGEVTVLAFPSLAPLVTLVPSKKGEWVKGLAFVGSRLLASTWAGVYGYDTKSWAKVELTGEVALEEGSIAVQRVTERVFLSRHVGGYYNSSTSSTAFGRGSAVELDGRTLSVVRWYQAPLSTSFVAPSPNGELLAGVAVDGRTIEHPKQIYVWSTKTGQLMRTYDFGTKPTAAVSRVAWLDDKTLLAGQGNQLQWLSVDAAAPQRSLPFDAQVMNVAVDSTRFVAAIVLANGRQITLVDAREGSVTQQLRQRVQEPAAQLAPRRLPHELLVGYGDRMRVWDLATGKVSPGFVKADNAWEFSAHPGADGIAVLQTAGPRGTSANEIWLTDKLGERVQTRALTDDARTFALDGKQKNGFSAGNRGVCRIGLVGEVFKTSACKTDISRRLGGVDSMTLSPDEKRLALGTSAGKIVLLDGTTSQQRAVSAQMPHEPVWQLAFSPDSTQLLSASMGGDVWLLDGSTLKHQALVTQRREYSNTYRAAIAFSADGRWFAASGDSTEVVLGSREKGGAQRRFAAGDGAVSSLGFTSDSRYLVTGTLDGLVRLWKPSDLSLVASLIAVDEADFVIVTPDNYYMASRGALDAVAFERDGVAYPFEQFDAVLNRPDIVLERLGYADKATLELLKSAAGRRMARLGARPGASDAGLFAQLPEVHVVTDKGAVVKDASVVLQVAASAEASLAALNVWVNDVPLRKAAGELLTGRTYSGPVTVPLSTGRNRIQVSVTDQRGIESKRATINVKRPGVASNKTFFVGLGVSRYSNHAYDLTYAAKDAKNLGEIFGAAGKALLLIDERATKEGLAAAREFLSTAREDDLVVVFIAGHGVVSNDLDYYFATHDVDFDHPEERGVRYEALEALFDGLRARNRLLLMDTCHSGEIDKPEVILASAPDVPAGARVRAVAARGVKAKSPVANANLEALLAQLFSDVRKGVGAVVVSSAAGTELAIESSELENGVFTYAWREALAQAKADKNSDGKVQVSEAREYVFARVKALTRGLQTPTMRREVIANDFAIVGR